MWSMYGKELARAGVDMLHQFMWRPRPASLLTPQQEKEVRKGLRSKRERYEAEDKQMRDSVSSGRAAQRRKLREEYASFRARAEAQLKEEQEKRMQARRDTGADDADVETIVETVETVISVTTEIDRNVQLLTEEDMRD